MQSPLVLYGITLRTNAHMVLTIHPIITSTVTLHASLSWSVRFAFFALQTLVAFNDYLVNCIWQPEYRYSFVEVQMHSYMKQFCMNNKFKELVIDVEESDVEQDKFQHLLGYKQFVRLYAKKL